MKRLSCLLATALMAACTDTSIQCSSQEVQDSVLDIVLESVAEKTGLEAAQSINQNLVTIRTTSEPLARVTECAAIVVGKTSRGQGEIDIKYTVEMADNKEEFYVTVYGL